MRGVGLGACSFGITWNGDKSEIAVEIEKQIRSARDGPRANRDPSLTIYVAEPSADMWAAYRTLRADLEEQLGARILPDSELPRTLGDSITAIDEDLKKSDLSIHLLGETGGFVPDGDGETPIVHLQLQRAALHSSTRKDFRRLIWCDPDLKPKVGSQSQLIDDLQRGKALLPTDEFAREQIEHFKRSACDVVRRLKGSEPAAKSPASLLKTVFLVYRSEDEAAALSLRESLYTHGLEVLRPEHEGSEQDQRNAFDFAAREADAAVVISDAAPEYWVLQTLRQLEDSEASRRKPLAAKAVFFAGPPLPRKKTFRSQLATHVIDATEDSPSEAFDQLVQALSAGAR